MALWAIARKDMQSIRANIQVWLPMLLLPLLFGVLFPGGAVFAISRFGADAIGNLQGMPGLSQLIEARGVGSTFDTIEQQSIYFLLNYMIAPLFLLIPLMAASVISADSFAGEKERGTLESLLFSPVGIRTLFLGKAAAAFLPAVGLTLITLALSTVVANVIGWPTFGRWFYPNANWIPLMLLVIPSLSFAAILVNVFISAKVATFQAAYQLGGLVVLPIVALIYGQIGGLLLFDVPVIFAIGVVLVVVDLGLFMALRRTINHTNLFESQVR